MANLSPKLPYPGHYWANFVDARMIGMICCAEYMGQNIV